MMVSCCLAGASISGLLPFQSTPVRGPSVRSEVNSLRLQVNATVTSSHQAKKDIVEVKTCYSNVKKKMVDQEKKIVQQGQTIAELEKKVNDLNQKFVDMAAELQKLKEVQEGDDSASARAIMHNDEELPDRSGDADTGRTFRNKALKRKPGGSYESRVKRSRN